MPSITTWTRLEPRARGDLRPSLEARVYDPAWLLARQWQVAEFRGQDAAFPIKVDYAIDVHPLASYQPPSGALDNPGPLPLEALAGPEPASSPTLAESAEAGAELLRLLRQHGCDAKTVSALRAARPLPSPDPHTVDAQGLSYLNLLGGRLPDATALGPLLREAIATNTLPPDLGVPPDGVDAVLAATKDWLAWLDNVALTTRADTDTWQPDRLEHDFTVTVASAAGPPFTLRADDWDGDLLDWYDFDIPAQPAKDAPPAGPPLPGVDPTTSTIAGHVAPHPLVYPGMPDHRWWAFEDANVNLADINQATDDLARMLVVEFASVYGNDWYLQPIELPASALYQVTDLTVTNSFGESQTLPPVAPSIAQFGTPPAALPDWCLFRHTVLQPDGTAPTLDGLFLPPALVDIQISPPIEDVRLIRDETADLAWAIEHTITGADSRPFDRYSGAVQQAPTPPPPGSTDNTLPLRYVLSTDIPAYCFPLVPNPDGSPTFYLKEPLRVDPGGASSPTAPDGLLLRAVVSHQAGQPVRQEEIPLEGIDLRRRHVLARSITGQVLLWTARQKRLGAHHGTIPLAFDQALSST